MPNEDELAEAVLQNVENGSYPESDGVISADLPPSAITSLLNKLSLARESVKSDIRALGGEAAPDIDGWIAQAKQIQADIERSKETARNIVKEAEASKELRLRVQDAASKIGLLENELIFNESLAETVEYIKGITEILRQAQNAAEQDRIRFAIEKVKEADVAIQRLTTIENTRAYGILQRQIDQLRSAIEENLNSCWNALIVVDSSDKFISIKTEINRQIPITMSAIVEAMSSLNLLDGAIDRLSTDLDKIVFAPRLTYDSTHQPTTIAIRDNNITVSGKSSDPTVSNALADLSLIVEYLNARFPSTISLPLSAKLLPLITSRLVSGWLGRSIPISIDGVTEFQDTVSHVQGLIERLKELGWRGWEDLDKWVDQIPNLWLAKRTEVALDSVRRLCKTGYKSRKSVGSNVPNDTPTAAIPRQEDAEDTPTAAIPQQEDAEDWGWTGEDDAKDSEGSTVQSKPNPSEDDDEVAADAWGLSEEDGANESKSDEPASKEAEPKHKPAEQVNKESKDNQDEDTEEWADWDEDNTQDNHKAPEIPIQETYTITDIPDALSESIIQIVTDATMLSTPRFSASSIAPAAAKLYELPSLMIAMYRALSTTTYTVESGSMLIYNDCIRLAERLKIYIKEQAIADRSVSFPNANKPSTWSLLEDQVRTIERFGDRIYDQEMTIQRTVVYDRLNDDEGHWTTKSIKDTVDRLYEMNEQWSSVLSHPKRLKSVGSLLSKVTIKMVAEIKAMDDISEDQSKRLGEFLTQISKVRELFVDEDSSENDPDLARYTIREEDWIRFEYLSEILVADLRMIEWMWVYTEVRDFFCKDEVINFIVALFSDSGYRRSAIHTIKTAKREKPKAEPSND